MHRTNWATNSVMFRPSATDAGNTVALIEEQSADILGE